MKSKPRLIGLLAIGILALCASHYVCLRQGKADQLSRLAPAVQRLKSGDEYIHLTYAIKALRPVAQHPNAITATDSTELCRQAEGFVNVIEQERLPELREVGDEAGVRRREKMAQEARTLIRQIKQ